jgi:hypothetical protein
MYCGVKFRLNASIRIGQPEGIKAVLQLLRFC